ncbi:MAG: hypothetical protein ICV60_23845 [Pyrinomonadaceae bacterium]|nr:hypothetical protein [Pyrinomonadaceae bacterium]
MSVNEIGVAFPISVRFEDGEVEQYEDIEAVECNLEDFDSDEDVAAEVRDILGRRVRLKVKLLELNELSLVP